MQTTTTGAMMSNHSPIASTAIGFFNDVENVRDHIISELTNMADDEVAYIRQQAESFGMASWRIECACDAEVCSRSQSRTARGRHDAEGRQIAKAVQDYALKCSVAMRTVYENAQIHQVFFSSARARTREIREGTLEHLRDKVFYRIAIYTADPLATIEMFAKAKADNAFFSTRDAVRMIKEETTPPLDEVVPALCDEPDIVLIWEKYQIVSRELISVAPRLQNLINGYIEEVQYELSMPSQSIEQTIFDLIMQGYDEADQIAGRMKKDRIYVIVWLNRLVEVGKLESFEKERAPGARGAARTGYREIDF
jgi:hypothetical protein